MHMRIFAGTGNRARQPARAGRGPRPVTGLACQRSYGDTPYGVSVTRADLRLVVENLGPLKHASVTLKPLTVLIGRNNTGKTYLAQALYAARRAVHDYRRSAPTLLTTEERVALDDLLLQRASQETDGPEHAFEGLQLQVGELPREVRLKVEAWVSQALGDAGESLEVQVCSTFGVPALSELARWDQPEAATVEVRRAHHEDTSTCLYGTNEFPKPRIGSDMTVTLDPFDYDPEGRSARFRHPSDDDEGGKEAWLNRQASRSLSSDVWHGYLRNAGLYGRAHYLPAGRSGLLYAWTDVIKLRLELERERFGLSRSRDPDLGGVALDFISSLAGIFGSQLRTRRRGSARQFRKPRHPALIHASTLLRQLMGGEIYLGSEDDMIPTLAYEQAGHRIPIRLASSMVADLAPLAMWIDEIVEPGDLLVVDEPESHLHPEAIRLVARVLVRLVGGGVNVVCATHSPVLIHELSNCLLLGQRQGLGTEDVERGYEGTDCLNLDDIAVHRFYRQAPDKPAYVTQVDIEPDWGIPEDEYVDVATEQSEDTSYLLDSLA